MDYQKTYTYPSTLDQSVPKQQYPTNYNAVNVPNNTQNNYIPATNQPNNQSQPINPQYQQPCQQMPQPVPQPLPQPTPQPTPQPVPPLFQEQSYIENILRLNKGKVGTFYFTYTDSNEWRDRIFKGVIEAAGRDHIIISDPKTGKRYLFQMIYFQWVEFDEEINYDYPYKQ